MCVLLLVPQTRGIKKWVCLNLDLSPKSLTVIFWKLKPFYVFLSQERNYLGFLACQNTEIHGSGLAKYTEQYATALSSLAVRDVLTELTVWVCWVWALPHHPHLRSWGSCRWSEEASMSSGREPESSRAIKSSPTKWPHQETAFFMLRCF